MASISFISETRKNKYDLRLISVISHFLLRDRKAHTAAIEAEDLTGGFEMTYPSASQMWLCITYLRWRKITYEEN